MKCKPYMTKQLIIGLGHKARQGKDTFVHGVRDHYDLIHQVQQLAFADALYKEVNEWLASNKLWAAPDSDCFFMVEDTVIPAWVKPDSKPEVSARSPLGKHPKLLQWWGTEYRRAQDPNYWVKRWVEAIQPDAEIVIASDMRFLNEAEVIKNLGGFTVNVTRRNQDGSPFIAADRTANHPSEIELDDYNYDFKLDNPYGCQEWLKEQAIQLVYYLMEKKSNKWQNTFYYRGLMQSEHGFNAGLGEVSHLKPSTRRNPD